MGLDILPEAILDQLRELLLQDLMGAVFCSR